jgi:N-acetylneuraminate synthase
MLKFKINNKTISNENKVYFIADIAANHDGNLRRAKKLIRLAAQNGADAAKFQHFKADTIVNKEQFDKRKKTAHQIKWRNSVYQVYKNASINNKWNKDLKKECKKYNIDFLTAPYDLNYVDSLNKFIPAYKIGSGDITWKEILTKIAKKNKPVLIATGASTFEDVIFACKSILKINKKLVVMQCNTNYTIDEKNFNYINLNFIKTLKLKFGKRIIVGLSDHTPGHTTVLGAIALGAKVIEKHFTDDNSRIGPDHKFSMNPRSWHEMIKESRRLEKALGDGLKKIEKNELESYHVQRRSVYTLKNLKKNQILKKKDLICLRPYIRNSISPQIINKFYGKKIKKNITKNSAVKKEWFL